MCYAKPGPYCSSVALKRLVVARNEWRNFREANYLEYEKVKSKFEKAVADFNITPEGLKRLNRTAVLNPTANNIHQYEKALALRQVILDSMNQQVPNPDQCR